MKFEMVVNTKTAGSLGIVIPPDILLRSDLVIEWHVDRGLQSVKSLRWAAQFLLSPGTDVRCAGLHHPNYRRMRAVLDLHPMRWAARPGIRCSVEEQRAILRAIFLPLTDISELQKLLAKMPEPVDHLTTSDC